MLWTESNKEKMLYFFLLLFAFKVTKAGRLSFTMSTNHMGVSISAESDSVGLGGTCISNKIMDHPVVAGPWTTL